MYLFELNGQEKTVGNFSDDELILTKYKLKCRALEIQKSEMLKIRENFQELNVKNDHISKSLFKLKAECELLRADLCKTLFNLKVAYNKQQILSKKKINDFLEKRKIHEKYLKISPFEMELEEIINRNNNLEEQWRKVSFLLNLTKNQYEETMSFLYKSFKIKVCEFCDTVCRLKTVNY